jgi:uncharacterized protein YmfQ (DUF2313 family)
VIAVTQRMIETMPPYYRGESFIEGFMDAVGRELQRVEDRAAAIQQGMFPQNTDDVYRLLSMWELLLGLPVAPPGVALTTRRNLVTATLASRSQSSGAAWVASVNQAMGGTPWTYQEGPAASTITIYISFSPSSFNSVQVQQLVRNITPAHLDLAVAYNQGFVVGEGRVGEDRL